MGIPRENLLGLATELLAVDDLTPTERASLERILGPLSDAEAGRATMTAAHWDRLERELLDWANSHGFAFFALIASATEA